jgi:hypothetical protein
MDWEWFCLENLVASNNTATREQVEDENDDGEDDEDMNPSTEGVAADQAQQPEDEENDGDGPKHG